MTTNISPDQYDAGFRSRLDPDDARPDVKQVKMVRLSEVRQLIIPAHTELPSELQKICVDCPDLVHLGHELFKAHSEEKPVIILGFTDAVAQAALQYPSLFNLQAAVITDIPGANYTPLFNQAVYGLNQISWAYLLDSLGMDDKLNFDVRAESRPRESDVEEPDVVSGDAGTA